MTNPEMPPLPKAGELLAAASKRMRADFEAIRATNPHRGEKGRELEQTLLDFLNQHLPKRFHATRGFIVDSKGTLSLHLDVIVYDQLDAFVFRGDTDAPIIPNDNVAAVIEIKSRLDKAALADATTRIAIVKALSKLEIGEHDSPLPGQPLVTANTRGILFAYESELAIDTAWKHLQEMNAHISSDHWIDQVVILDAAVLSYGLQIPYFNQVLNFMGKTSSDARIDPYYVIPTEEQTGSQTLSRFVATLQVHLGHFRRRPTQKLDFFVNPGWTVKTFGGYWPRRDGILEPVPDSQFGDAKPVGAVTITAEFGEKLGGIEWAPWADGHVLAFLNWTPRPPDILLELFMAPYGESARLTQVRKAPLFMTDIRPGAACGHFDQACAELRVRMPHWRVA